MRQVTDQPEEAVSDERRSMLEDDHVTRLSAFSILRSRAGEETGMHSSLWVKHIGRPTDSSLNGPTRRRVLQRQSEGVEDDHESNRYTAEREMRESTSHYAREENKASSRLVRTTSSRKLLWIDSDPRILENPARATPRVMNMPSLSRPRIFTPTCGASGYKLLHQPH